MSQNDLYRNAKVKKQPAASSFNLSDKHSKENRDVCYDCIDGLLNEATDVVKC